MVFPGKAGLREVPNDTPPVTLGQFMFRQGVEEACGGPSLFVGALGKTGPEFLNGGQAQFCEEDGETGGVDVILAHPPLLRRGCDQPPVWRSCHKPAANPA